MGHGAQQDQNPKEWNMIKPFSSSVAGDDGGRDPAKRVFLTKLYEILHKGGEEKKHLDSMLAPYFRGMGGKVYAEKIPLCCATLRPRSYIKRAFHRTLCGFRERVLVLAGGSSSGGHGNVGERGGRGTRWGGVVGWGSRFALPTDKTEHDCHRNLFLCYGGKVGKKSGC